MGGCLGKEAAVRTATKEAGLVRVDNRKRNSLVFSLVEWVETDYGHNAVKLELLLSKRTKEAAPVSMDPRGSRAAKTAESVALGNLRALREVVIGHFSQINKRYATMANDAILHICAREGYAAMVEFVVDPRNVSQFDTTTVDYDAENEKWRTPLHIAFTPPQETFCAKRNGVDEHGVPKCKKPDGVFVDSDWIRPGGATQRQRIVELLVGKGADVHRLDYHGHSPLHLACVWGWASTAKLLLEHGADPERANVQGQNALMAAAEFPSHTPILDLILSETHISIEAKNVDGETALHYAVNTGDVDLVVCLLEFGSNVNAESYAKESPLRRACRNNDSAVVHALLDHRATRRLEAFALLRGVAQADVQRRLDMERDEKLRDFEAAKREKERLAGKDGGRARARSGNASGVGEWRPYRDKRGRGIFYYNKVSRVSQYEIPDDYEKDRSYIMKEATFGMHFYH
ncbi:ankyrin repeat-containing domain protein [Pelagophyceae sp. CCMP2097]|nr:ankyrin repeat-containing domain protein [Pelagophyceae sp. CCMP2097]